LIEQAEITPENFKEAVLAEGQLGGILVKFMITEYCVNGDVDEIQYTITMVDNSSTSENLGRYVVYCEISKGELIRLEIEKILYYSHG